MEQLLENLSELNNNLNDILCILNNIDLKDNSVVDELNNKNKVLHQSNLKLLEEIKEKDKIISMNQKTIMVIMKNKLILLMKNKNNQISLIWLKQKTKKSMMNKIIDNLNKEVISLKIN